MLTPGATLCFKAPIDSYCITQFLIGSTQKTCLHIILYIYIYLPKTKKFGCMGRGDMTSIFFSKVVKY